MHMAYCQPRGAYCDGYAAIYTRQALDIFNSYSWLGRHMAFETYGFYLNLNLSPQGTPMYFTLGPFFNKCQKA